METLHHLLGRLSEVDDALCIFAVMPWDLQSQTILVRDNEYTADIEQNGKSYSYFLEVDIIKDLLRTVSHLPFEQQCARVIYYAINDA